MLELRVSALLVLAAYLVSLDAVILGSRLLSLPSAFGYHNFTRSPRSVAHMMLASLAVGTLIFWLQTLLFPSLATRIVPLGTLCAIVAIILSQRRLLRVLKRISIGGLSSENRLGDILVSDGLVSMAGVLVDVAYAFALTYYGVPASAPLNRAEHLGFKILLVACIPQGIRIKQCIIDYRRTRDRQHLLNLLKYLVGNIPHALRANMATLDPAESEQAAVRRTLEAILLKSLFANAVYSLAWDLLVDWKLLRLRDPAKERLRFPHWWYYLAIACDILLRFVYLAAKPVEHVVFSLQALELIRRGVWVVFRVESEPIELTEEIELADAK